MTVNDIVINSNSYFLIGSKQTSTKIENGVYYRLKM